MFRSCSTENTKTKMILPPGQDEHGHPHVESSTKTYQSLNTRLGIRARLTGSVMSRIPSHSLVRCLSNNTFELENSAYKIIVAVPTNSRLAFSPPALLGCTFVSFASARDGATSFPDGKSLVGA